MEEREVGNCDGMEGGKESAHCTLLARCSNGEAPRLARSSCKRVTC